MDGCGTRHTRGSTRERDGHRRQVAVCAARTAPPPQQQRRHATHRVNCTLGLYTPPLGGPNTPSSSAARMASYVAS
jgi:hypothetical protein